VNFANLTSRLVQTTVVLSVAVLLTAPAKIKAQAVNGGLNFPTSSVINNVLQQARGFQLPGAFVSAIGSSVLTELNNDGSIGGNPGAGTVQNTIQWEGNSVGVTCNWSFSTDASGQIVFNFTLTNDGQWNIFSPKSQSKTYNIPTGILSGLLSSSVSPQPYPTTYAAKGNTINNTIVGSGYTYTVQVVVYESWDGTNLTDYVENFTYFFGGGPINTLPVAPN
jgi:hypothetical protein